MLLFAPTVWVYSVDRVRHDVRLEVGTSSFATLSIFDGQRGPSTEREQGQP